jgi:hypothetical protein
MMNLPVEYTFVNAPSSRNRAKQGSKWLDIGDENVCQTLSARHAKSQMMPSDASSEPTTFKTKNHQQSMSNSRKETVKVISQSMGVKCTDNALKEIAATAELRLKEVILVRFFLKQL